MKWRIPIAEPLLDDAEKKAVADVMDSGRISASERVAEFEELIAKYLGRKYAVACSSGTCANEIMLMALYRPVMQDLISSGRLRRCAVPACTSVAVSNPLLLARVAPNFIDLDDKLCMDVQKITDHKANDVVLNVHAYGSYPHDFSYLIKFCHEWHLPLLEDACVALGSTYGNGKLGTFGVMASLSFYVNKTITTGEGGMIVTDDPTIAEYCRQYVNHGRKKSVYHEDWYYHQFGRNSKMTDIQAAIGLAQFQKLPQFLDARRKIGERLREVVEGDPRYVSFRPEPGVVPWSFWVANLDGRVDMREASMQLQTKYGIETRPTLPVLPHLPVYNMKDMRFPMGEASQNGFLVSCSPAILAHDDLDYLCESLGKVLNLD